LESEKLILRINLIGTTYSTLNGELLLRDGKYSGNGEIEILALYFAY